jgi:uncharacterized protein involved in cysteine biosynthesis
MRRKLFRQKHKIIDVKRIIDAGTNTFETIIRKNVLIHLTSLVPNINVTITLIVTLFGHRILEVKTHPRKLQPVIYGHRW